MICLNQDLHKMLNSSSSLGRYGENNLQLLSSIQYLQDILYLSQALDNVLHNTEPCTSLLLHNTEPCTSLLFSRQH